MQGLNLALESRQALLLPRSKLDISGAETPLEVADRA
jgi:hypothetical protein